MSYIQTTLEDAVGTIIFDHDRKRNCLGDALIGEVMAAMESFLDREARVIVLRAQPGVNVWSAGHDVNELPPGDQDPLDHEVPLLQLLHAVQDAPVPVIALIEGSVWGGACDLAFSCDILIGTPDASFAITPAKLGIPYNPSGLTHFIPVIGLHKVKEMFFTARPVPADDALRVGILNHVVPADQIEDFTQDLARSICQNAPLAVRVIKQQLRLLCRGQLLDAETHERLEALRREVWTSADYQEGIRAFKEKRRPRFLGR